MKKFIISICTLTLLVAYSLIARHEQSEISQPNALSTTITTSPTRQTSDPGSLPSAADSHTVGNAKAYKDGSHTGRAANAYYGEVQVKVSVNDGRITDVSFVQYPDTHSTSISINRQAMPYLQQEAIKSQSPNVDIISGATYTSQAFIQSLQDALTQA